MFPVPTRAGRKRNKVTVCVWDLFTRIDRAAKEHIITTDMAAWG